MDPFRFPWAAAILAGMAGGVASSAFIGRVAGLLPGLDDGRLRSGLDAGGVGL